MRTQDLIGAQLDWAVAKCAGWIKGDVTHPKFCRLWRDQIRTPAIYPSTDWAQGGALIEREGIGFFCNRTTATGARFTPDAGADWRAFALNKHGVHYFGPTPLIAAMRCFCCAKLGDEINIPEELL